MRLLPQSPLGKVRPRRPALVNICPVCGRALTEHDERFRLRGRTYVHRRCATYSVRSLGPLGLYEPRSADAPLAQRSLAE